MADNSPNTWSSLMMAGAVLNAGQAARGGSFRSGGLPWGGRVFLTGGLDHPAARES